jgi:hypothetical protein
MTWGKQSFSVEYIAAMDLLEPARDLLRKLVGANPTLHREFIMASVEISKNEQDFYIGVPNKTFLALFDGFDPVDQSDVPGTFDSLYYATR